MVKNPPASAGDIRDAGSILGEFSSPGEEHDDPLQYSCPDNPMDRGAGQAMVHRVTNSQTRLKRLSTHTRIDIQIGVSSRQLSLESRGFPGCKHILRIISIIYGR